MEEAEEALLIPIAPDDVERWVEIAASHLRRATGVELPLVSSPPALAVERTFVDWLDASIPVGSAFYPCCGSDLEQLPRLFGRHVSTYHFADAYRSVGRATSRRDRAKQASIEHIGNVVVGSSQTATMLVEGQLAVFYRKDSLLTLIEDIRDLAVFYYRGDSGGEGGSGQWVLGPVAFTSCLHDCSTAV